MKTLNRREFVGAGALGLIGATSGSRGVESVVHPSASSEVQAGAGATRTLAEYVVRARPEDVPEPV